MTFNESWPWKRELGACAERLRKVAQKEFEQDLWSEDDSDDNWDVRTEEIFEVERDVMVGCFTLRRLLEMPFKVTQETRKRAVRVTNYPLREGHKPPSNLYMGDAFELYDLTKPEVAHIPTQKMCNLFIHSHVLHFAWDLIGLRLEEANTLQEGDPRIQGPIRLGGFYVTTDIIKDKFVRVDIETLIESFEEMFRDEVRTLRVQQDFRGKWKIIESSSALPGSA